MRIVENVRENKVEQVTFRLSARYKEYLERWANESGKTVGALLNDWIKFAKFREIKKQGIKFAHEETAKFFKIPLKTVESIETTEDWQKLKETLGEEKYNAYCKKWNTLNDEEQDRIAEEEGFVWSYDTDTGLI